MNLPGRHAAREVRQPVHDASPIDLAHPAGPDRRDELVGTPAGAGSESQGRRLPPFGRNVTPGRSRRSLSLVTSSAS